MKHFLIFCCSDQYTDGFHSFFSHKKPCCNLSLFDHKIREVISQPQFIFTDTGKLSIDPVKRGILRKRIITMFFQFYSLLSDTENLTGYLFLFDLCHFDSSHSHQKISHRLPCIFGKQHTLILALRDPDILIFPEYFQPHFIAGYDPDIFQKLPGILKYLSDGINPILTYHSQHFFIKRSFQIRDMHLIQPLISQITLFRLRSFFQNQKFFIPDSVICVINLTGLIEPLIKVCSQNRFLFSVSAADRILYPQKIGKQLLRLLSGEITSFHPLHGFQVIQNFSCPDA